MERIDDWIGQLFEEIKCLGMKATSLSSQETIKQMVPFSLFTKLSTNKTILIPSYFILVFFSL